jgi:hypothetical protein
MGYDMYLVDDQPAEEAEAEQAAEREFHRLVNLRDSLQRGDAGYEAAQEAVSAAYDAWSEKQTGYYRLNIFGMQKARQLMGAAGMLKWDDPGRFPEPDLPQEVMENLADFEWDETPPSEAFLAEMAEQGITKEQVMAYHEASLATQRHLKRHDGDTPGIAGYKLGSNDGWLVTPGECWSALELWNRLSPEEKGDVICLGVDPDASPDDDASWNFANVSEWWQSWLLWLDKARRSGGFRVY